MKEEEKSCEKIGKHWFVQVPTKKALNKGMTQDVANISFSEGGVDISFSVHSKAKCQGGQYCRSCFSLMNELKYFDINQYWYTIFGLAKPFY